MTPLPCSTASTASTAPPTNNPIPATDDHDPSHESHRHLPAKASSAAYRVLVTDNATQPSPAEPARRSAVPPAVRAASEWSLRLLVIGAGIPLYLWFKSRK